MKRMNHKMHFSLVKQRESEVVPRKVALLLFAYSRSPIFTSLIIISSKVNAKKKSKEKESAKQLPPQSQTSPVFLLDEEEEVNIR